MATTIITKNGSGAPAAGDLVQGELAVDLTNKTLYSKDSSGNVFKVGNTGGGSSGTFTDLVATDSFTSPGIDDNATSTQITVTDTDVDFSGNIDVTGTATLPDADVTTLDVTGTSTLADADVTTLDVTGTSTLADADVVTLDVTGTTTLADADVVTLDVTGTLTASGLLYPTTDGTDGQALLTDGSGTLAFGDVVGGIDYTTQTSNYTLEANQGVIADTTGGTFVVTLPLTPAEGDQVVVADGGDWATINLTVGRNGQTIEGVASDLIMDVGGISVTMVFDGTTWQLYPATGTSTVAPTLDQVTTAGNITTNDITVGNLTSTGIDDNATSTAITIDANQNVGIGTDAPTRPLVVSDGGTGGIEFFPSATLSRMLTYNRSTNQYIDNQIGGNNIIFQTGTNNNSERMRIDSSGNVGIGTNTPAPALANGTTLHISGATTTSELRLTRGNGTDLSLVAGSSGAALETTNATRLELGTNSTTRMTIDATGNLGIGAPPDTTGFGGTFKYLGINGGSGNGVFNGQTTSTTVNKTAAQFMGTTTGTSGYQRLGGMAVVNGASSAANAEGAVVFYTATGGSIAERMRINGAGRVDITGSLYVNGTPKIGYSELITALSTLRKATIDDTQDIRESLRDAIDELVEGFEQEIATMPALEEEQD